MATDKPAAFSGKSEFFFCDRDLIASPRVKNIQFKFVHGAQYQHQAILYIRILYRDHQLFTRLHFIRML